MTGSSTVRARHVPPAVPLVPAEPPPQPPGALDRLLHLPRRDVLALLAAFVLPLAVCAVLVPFRTHLDAANAALVLVLAVVLVAVAGNRVAGAASAVFAALWFDFFLTRPYETLDIARASEVTTAVLLLAVGLAVSQLAAHARRLHVVAITDDAFLGRLHRTARLAHGPASGPAVVEDVRRQLVELLELRACRFEYGSLTGHPARLEQDGTVVWGLRAWNADRDGLPDTEVEIRVFHNGRFHGRFMMTPTRGAVPSAQARLVAATLADQAGSALDAARP